MRRTACAAVVLAALLVGGCAALDLESIAGATSSNQLRGEVRRIDTRHNELEIRSDSRQQTRMSYDSRTRVTYRSRDYPITSLRSGDRVAVRVQRTQRGALYAQRVVVETLGREPGGSVRVQQFQGRVASVEVNRGRFTLQTARNTYLVTLPYNPNRTTRTRLERLRPGDSVRFEGELLSTTRIELHRFR